MRHYIYILILVIAFTGFYCSEDSPTEPINNPADDRIVFYSLDQKVFVTDINMDSIKYIADGAYPIWFESKSLIGFHSPSNDQYHIIDADSKQNITTYDISGHGTFSEGRYSEYMNRFLFAVNTNGNSSIAIMDLLGDLEFISSDHPMTNPVCSGVDDWVYFLINRDGTRDVWRMKPDGSSTEPITNSQEFYYSNLSISYEGYYIAVPKWNDNYHYIAIIDTRTNDERLIDLTSLNLVGFTSFTEDNKYIYFTGGDTRDLYRINFDGNNLIPLTDSMFGFYYRPLCW